MLLQLAPGVRAGQVARPEPLAPFDLQTYTSKLERWSSSAERLRRHPEEAPALRKQLPGSLTVTVKGEVFRVSTRPLEAALDRAIRDPKATQEASREFTADAETMLDDARAFSMEPSRDDRLARSKLNDILKRREFRDVRAPDDAEAFWNRTLAWLWQWLSKILERAGGHPRVTHFLLWGIVFGLGVMFVGWLVHSLTHFRSERVSTPVQRGVPASNGLDEVQQARGAAGRGEFREAIRMIYWAAVRRLAETGTWEVDPARTHREYTRLLPAGSAQRPAWVAIATHFEQVWYGHFPASPHEYQAALEELESLR